MRTLALTIALLLSSALSAAAQEFKVDFGVDTSDPNAPIEVVADSLSVDQDTGKAVFDGNVEITQGGMSLLAALVTVVYSEDGGDIAQLIANGDVRINSGADSATADSAEYDVTTSMIHMVGNVTLVQQGASVSAGKMDVNLTNNTAALHGRVRTVLQPGGN